jgi:hypothetical protein
MNNDNRLCINAFICHLDVFHWMLSIEQDLVGFWREDHRIVPWFMHLFKHGRRPIDHQMVCQCKLRAINYTLVRAILSTVIMTGALYSNAVSSIVAYIDQLSYEVAGSIAICNCDAC